AAAPWFVATISCSTTSAMASLRPTAASFARSVPAIIRYIARSQKAISRCQPGAIPHAELAPSCPGNNSWLSPEIRVRPAMSLRYQSSHPLIDGRSLACEGGSIAQPRRVNDRARNYEGRLPWSLAGRRLPKFYLVSFWIDDPGKLPVLGIVDLFENVAAFFAQDFDEGVKILHPV